MSRLAVRLLAGPLLAAALASPSQAALYTFSSGDFVGFSPTQVFTEGTASFPAQATGGNPGAFFFVQQTAGTVASPGTPAEPADISYFIDSGQSFDPGALGAITRMDFSMDTRLYFGFGDGTRAGIALSQGGNIYFGPSFLANVPSVWTPQQILSISAASFLLATSAGYDGAQHPDFSAAGGPLLLGFFTANTSIGGQFTIQSGYDNWRVEITTAPEPTTSALLVAGAFGIGTALRRRGRRAP